MGISTVSWFYLVMRVGIAVPLLLMLCRFGGVGFLGGEWESLLLLDSSINAPGMVCFRN
jgi:hypothetical protein